MEATEKKLREAAFFLWKLVEEERRILRPEPEALDFYLSAFLSAARSVGDIIGVEEGDRYRNWFAQRKLTLPADERVLLKFTNDQRVLTVHVRGPDVQRDTTQIPIHELQRELEAGGGSLENRAGGVPGSPLPSPQAEKSVLSFSGRPSANASELCQQYLELLGRLVREYREGQSPPNNTLQGTPTSGRP